MAGAEIGGPAVPGEDVKPFTPEKAREIVMSLQQPAVFCNMVGDWPALHWDVKYLSAMLDGKTIQFRIGLKTMDLVPQFETSCSYVKATLEEFLAWSSGQPSHLSGPFSCFEHSKYWAYADYKYIARIFEDKEEVFQTAQNSEDSSSSEDLNSLLLHLVNKSTLEGNNHFPPSFFSLPSFKYKIESPGIAFLCRYHTTTSSPDL